MSTQRLRLASEEDLPAINDLYNHYVLHSTATYQTEPSTLPQRRAWFLDHGPHHPITVIERDGQIVGWGALSRFHPRAAYQPTVENSVYIRHDALGEGLGTQVLQDLIDRASALHYHSMIALVSADQSASLRLHERLGFQHAGRLKEVGRKFNRWLDVIYLQKLLHG